MKRVLKLMCNPKLAHILAIICICHVQPLVAHELKIYLNVFIINSKNEPMFAHMAIELTCGKLLRSKTRKVVDLRGTNL